MTGPMTSKGHGRVERRECDRDGYLDPQGQWPQLKAAVKVVGQRRNASQPRAVWPARRNNWPPSAASENSLQG